MVISQCREGDTHRELCIYLARGKIGEMCHHDKSHQRKIVLFLTRRENAMLYRYLDRCGELILVRAASSWSISIHIASTIMIHDYIVQVVSLATTQPLSFLKIDNQNIFKERFYSVWVLSVDCCVEELEMVDIDHQMIWSQFLHLTLTFN